MSSSSQQRQQETLTAPTTAVVISQSVSAGVWVEAGTTLAVLESMKMQIPLAAPADGTLQRWHVAVGEAVEQHAAVLDFQMDAGDAGASNAHGVPAADRNATAGEALSALQRRLALTGDAARSAQVAKRHEKGYRSARENLADLVDADSFIEYGQLAVAAQRQRRDIESLQRDTAADGIITGLASINATHFGRDAAQAAVIVNDYSVLAGTQGYFHHRKLDRALEVARRQRLPVVMYTEGGGGRPGDTDVLTQVAGLDVPSFASWAGLRGVVPRIAVNNGYCFAGNAALFGAADIRIATRSSCIGMAGPAMIEGGGLGSFPPTAIGPIAVQAGNGVVDIVAEDEAEATALARQALGYFQGSVAEWSAAEQDDIADALPVDRRYAYDVRRIIQQLADCDSVLELGREFAGAAVCCLARLEGMPVGLMASNCRHLGGAVDAEAADKLADFIALCARFSLPVVSLVDTPGFMVGPDSEEQAAVRRMSRLFAEGAQAPVPWVAIFLRRAYGLGAMAMAGGSFARPVYAAAWPSGEFGAMGLEGAVYLGYRKQLQAEPEGAARQALFDRLLAEAYEKGRATEMAAFLEIDAVIDPADTRRQVVAALRAAASRSG